MIHPTNFESLSFSEKVLGWVIFHKQSIVGVEPETAGLEAQTLPVSYATLTTLNLTSPT